MSDSKEYQSNESVPLLPPEALPIAGRWVATALAYGLDVLGAQHARSFGQGYHEGHAIGRVEGFSAGSTHGQAEGFEQGRNVGIEEGRDAAHRAGFDVGYAQGYEDGQRVLEIVDRRSQIASVPGVDDRLFDAWTLPVDDELRDQMRRDVHAKLPEYKHPTEDQWRMIFSTTPSTCVVAGAGSGKSTTLVLRILLLHHYLGFELSSLTVVTFTNMSRWDFIGKLTDTFKLWNIRLSDDTAKALVFTFHSKILRFIRALPGVGRIVPFEFCGEGVDKAVEKVDCDEEDTIPFETRLSGGQFDLLNAAYTRLYKNNERFRALMQILYQRSVTLRMLDGSSEQAQRQLGRIDAISRRDVACMDAVEAIWREAGKWPIDGIEAKRATIQILGRSFQVHGKLSSRDIYVVLGPERLPGEAFKRSGSRIELVREMGGKRTLFRAYSNVPVIWLSEPDAADEFLQWLAQGAASAPGFDYQITGELGATNILECFVGAAAFIENLGLDVSDMIAGMKLLPSDPDREFFEALGLFWPAFEQYLGEQQPRVMTFNRMFALFGENSPRNLHLVTDETLRTMSHLMIDEFQDISPQIVSWVRATLTEIRRRGDALHEGRAARHSSLLCVGDDWQSIYGWRGSAPKFFVEFASEFRASATTPVMLRENFRSHQFVIDAAEHVVRTVSTIPGKRAHAAGAAAKDPVPVEILDRDDDALAELVHRHYDSGQSVMVLFRRREDGKEMHALLADLIRRDGRLPLDKRRLQLLTYHRSKGLEAEAVFLVGDCMHLTNSPYKNQAYLAAGLEREGEGTPFDDAQREEILRLAYVAITRAVRHCYWFIDASPGAESRPRASAQVTRGKPYFQDRRRR